ncbi:S-layer homology domain-containing protein [Sporosarcina sp. FSL W8-0480]|uniref:S-layer homology domain-containing protein n=1 Tax=Sporosarcina sp. FSL W8-0480 TaxID=2954701 RepID=UPI0030DA22C9
MAHQPKAYKKFVATAATATLVASAIVPVASAAETKSFTDVSKAYADAVNYLVAEGITQGTSATTFGTTQNITRGDAAVFIARALKLDVDNAKDQGFTDLNSRVKNAVNAVVAAEIASGKSATSFAPEANITRQEMAKMLANAYKLTAKENANFTDVNSNWIGYVSALKEAGITLGKTETTFAPTDNLTRGEFALFMYRAEGAPAVGEVALTSVKASGAKAITVEFNKAVDTTKASIVVKKGNIVVNVDSTKYSDDKKSVVINTTSKLTKGEYTVTVSNLAEKDLVGTAVADDEKVAKINVLSTTAPLNPDAVKIGDVEYKANETAFVSYEVLNQYGEELANQTINWTQSTGGKVADNGSGQLTVGNTATAGTKFIPGNKVFLTGVYANTATVVNAEVTIGLESKASVADIKGVYNVSTGKLADLPAGFGADKFELLFEVKDQYGNKISTPNLGELTYLSDNPLFVLQPSKDDATTRTVGNVTYQAIKLVPGSQAAKGGTANIQIISNNTGNVSKYTISADALASVKSFRISAPEKLIAGGEKVEIPFSAVDQYGNAITKHADLTGVTLSDGLSLEKQQDGSAKLYYTAADNATQHDTIATITSLVPTNGDYSNIQLTIKPNAVPTSVIGLADKVSTQIASGNKVTAKGEDLLVQDQYGRTLTKAQINAWLNKEVKDKDGNTVGDNAFVIESTVGASTPFEVTSTVTATDSKQVVVTASGDSFVINAASVAATSATEKLVFSLSTTTTPAPVTVSSKSVTFTRVALSEYVSYEVADLGTMYNNAKEDTKTTGYDVTPKVYGVTAAGAKVLLPASQYTITPNTSKLTVSEGKITDVAEKGFKDTDFKDNNGNAKDVAVKVSILVNDSTGAAAATFTKDLVVSNGTPVASDIALSSSVKNGSAFVKHTGKAVTATDLNKFVVQILDQYGVVIEPTSIITISKVEKVDGSKITVSNNATSTASIANAEVGDKFTATFRYTGGKSVSVDFIVSDN